MSRVREYQDAAGRSPYAAWFERLGPVAAAKVATAITRLELGNTANVKSVGAGVHELKVAHGPGYRVYFGNDAKTLVILLCGGTKKRQKDDIKKAKERWDDYKKRKRKEG